MSSEYAPMSRVGSINGLRTMAMLWVFGYHMWEFGGRPSAVLNAAGFDLELFWLFHHSAGVDLFMVISGFCLFYPLCLKSDALDKFRASSFYARRFWRLSPTYYAAMFFVALQPVVLVAAFKMLGMEANWQPFPDTVQWITHFLYIHTLFPETWGGINGSFWAIGTFAFLYLTFPLVVAGYKKYGIKIILPMAAVSIAYATWANWYTSGAPFQTRMVFGTFFLAYWIEFAAGMAAAWLVARHKNQPAIGPWAGTAVIAFAAAVYGAWSADIGTGLPVPMRQPCLALAFGTLIVALAISRSWLRLLFDNPIAASLATVSFTVYLIHQPTAWFISEFGKKHLGLDGLPLLAYLWALGLPVVIGIAFVFYQALEKPFLRYSRRYSPSAQPPLPMISTPAKEGAAYVP